MPQHTGVLAVLAAFTLAGCSLNGQDKADLPSTPTAVARIAPTVVTTPRAPATPAATATARASADPTQITVPTEPVAVQTPLPDVRPEDFEPSAEARTFAARLQDAIFALEDLPGYTYTVTDPQLAPGLALTGRVASPDQREWIVSELGAPEHVVARWVLVGTKAYTDYGGTWETTDKLPFDRNSPLSFAADFMNQLFEPYGPTEDEKTSSKAARVGTHTATRYDLQRELAAPPEAAGAPRDPLPMKSSDTAWIAKDGGYLLRYTGSPLYGAPGGDRTVHVSPLERAPSIQTPKVGEPAFSGAPPPWRASVIGRERLESLKSYAFKATQEGGPLTIQSRGRISRSQGTLSGTVPDYSSFREIAEVRPHDIKMTDVALTYIGRKVWAQRGDGKWRRIAFGIASGFGAGADEDHAYQLAFSVPGGPPEVLLGEQAEFAQAFSAGVFGLNTMYGPANLSKGRLIGTERVNGVVALHYAGTTNSVGPDGSEKADVWLAKDGLYLVRSRTPLPALQSAEFSFEGSRTNVDILDANKPFRVNPPVP